MPQEAHPLGAVVVTEGDSKPPFVSPAAAASLARLIVTHSLPADTNERFRRSVAPLAEFPRLGKALEGGGDEGLRFILGPWRWMLIVYTYGREADVVAIATVQDGRTSAAATALD